MSKMRRNPTISLKKPSTKIEKKNMTSFLKTKEIELFIIRVN